MRRLWRRLIEVSIGGVMLLLGRWLLRVSRPVDDLVAVGRVWDRLVGRLYDAWTILWRAYGPVTEEMRASWERLRARYQGGAFGSEGT